MLFFFLAFLGLDGPLFPLLLGLLFLLLVFFLFFLLLFLLAVADGRYLLLLFLLFLLLLLLLLFTAIEDGRFFSLLFLFFFLLTRTLALNRSTRAKGASRGRRSHCVRRLQLGDDEDALIGVGRIDAVVVVATNVYVDGNARRQAEGLAVRRSQRGASVLAGTPRAGLTIARVVCRAGSWCVG